MSTLKIAAYLIIAVIIGLVISAGIAGLMHQPLPLQVPVQDYAPASPPAPAVPTIAPANPDTSKFAPAPAPVIVTTQPLPTITPVPKDTTDSLSDTTLTLSETISKTLSLLGLLTIALGVAGIAYTMIGLRGPYNRQRR